MNKIRSLCIVSIVLLSSFIVINAYSESNIPEWIKKYAYWWSQDDISDQEFVRGLQYLINNDILIVKENIMPDNEIFQQFFLDDDEKTKYSWMDKYGNYGKDINGNIIYYDIDNNLILKTLDESVPNDIESNEKLETLFPSRTDLADNWIIREDPDFQPEFSDIPAKSKIYTIDEKSGLRVIVYEFDSPVESRSIYDEQVNEIQKRGGYTEFEVPTYFHGGKAPSGMFSRDCFGIETVTDGRPNVQIRCISESNNYYVYVTATGSNDDFELANKFTDIVLVKIEK